MRAPKGLTWLAGLDFLVFIVLWGTRALATASGHAVKSGVQDGYWITSAVGLVIAVYGFIALTRGGESALRRSVLCILLVMIPGCAALIGLLSHLGGHPV